MGKQGGPVTIGADLRGNGIGSGAELLDRFGGERSATGRNSAFVSHTVPHAPKVLIDEPVSKQSVSPLMRWTSDHIDI